MLLSKHLINLLPPQPYFLFLRLAYQSKVGYQSRVQKLKSYNFQKFIYCKYNKEQLELSKYFQKLIFNQQTAHPQKDPTWARSLQGSSLATPLVLHLVHQLPLRKCVLS